MARPTGSKHGQRGKARREKKVTAKLLARKAGSSDARRSSRPRLPAAGGSERAVSLVSPEDDATHPAAGVSAAASQPRLARLPVPPLLPESVRTPPPDLDFELTFEHEFFTKEVAHESLPPLVEEEDAPVERLTLAQHQRRLWLRRRVAQLIAVLAAFAVLAFLLRR